MINSNHLKSLVRRLLKNKGTTAINVLGLAVGIATSILLLLHVQYESSYDEFNQYSENLYQVLIHSDDGEQFSVTPPLAQKLAETFPEIQNTARYVDWDDEWLVRSNKSSFKIPNAMGADNSIFELFTFEFIKGDPAGALNRPKTVVLNQTTAKNIFGNDNPIGNILIVSSSNSTDTMEVTGVVMDFPKNSTIQFNLLFSIAGFDAYWKDQWMNHTLSAFVLLNEKSSIETLQSKMPDFTRKVLNQFFLKADGRTYDDFIKQSGMYQFNLKLLTDVYLNSEIGGNQTLKSRLRLLVGIGFLIFLIACINYTNLSTIQIITRAKEVGIRKITGSSSFRLLINSYFETAMIVILALVLAVLMLIWVLPYFNQFTGKQLAFEFFKNPVLYGGFILAFLIATIVAGAYPALKLSRISPTTAFKGILAKRPQTFSFRNGLIIWQFVVCIAMISVTVLFTKQINFITTKNLGFKPDQILVIKDAFLANKGPFKQAVQQIPNVETASFSNTVPGRHFNDQGIHVQGTPPSSKYAHVFNGDSELMELFNLELVTGRWFSEDSDKDKASVILNETALKTLNIIDPLNTILDKGSWSDHSADQASVIGVVKDFNFKSLQWPIQPMALYTGSNRDYDNAYLSIKISQSDYQHVVEKVEQLWKIHTGNLPFEYFFLDQDFNRNYQSESHLQKIFTWFSLLAIMVTCLGLLGLSSFLILRQTKEIGIRKVNGASVSQIISMLNYSFIKWVLIAFIIATPVAYYASNRWLQTFAYKTNLSWWVFALAGIIAVFIAITTVSWQSWRAAKRNPVEALRYE